MDALQKKKVFVLGLDGATFDIMMPMIARGELPTFARFVEQGARARLISTVVSNSAPAWTSFATGKNPGKHSISGFFKMVPEAYQLRLLNGKDNKAKTLWEVADEHGKRSIVVNIPMTYPPKQIENGIVVSGLDAPSLNSDFTHPPEFREELLRVVPDYKINLHLGGYLHNERRRRQAIDVMLSSIRAREKAVVYMMEKFPWDVFAVRFNSPDNVQHQFWRYMDPNHPHHDPRSPKALKDAVFTIYKELDRAAATIVSHLPKGCLLIVMSDHGAGPRTDKTIRLNEWLRSLGYLTSKASKKRGKRYVFSIMEKGLSMFLRRVPPAMKELLKRIAPGVVGRTWTYFRFPNIEWEKTRAFVGETEGIRIHVKDKYPQGVVGTEEYDGIREHIIAELRKLRDPETGERIFERVLKREEAFDGPYVADFPDIIALTTKDQYNISAKIAPGGNQSLIANEVHWREINGSHRPAGIMIICGDDVRKNTELNDASITDVFPTTLYVLGLPVPSDADGRVVVEAFEDAYIGQNPVRYDEVSAGEGLTKRDDDQYTDKEKEELVDHLRGLGYIE